MSALTKSCGLRSLITTAKRRLMRKMAGLKNGVLLAAAENADFKVLSTTDQEIPYQQNLGGRRISILILCAPTNRLADLKPLVPAVLNSLDSIEPGQVLRLG